MGRGRGGIRTMFGLERLTTGQFGRERTVSLVSWDCGFSSCFVPFLNWGERIWSELSLRDMDG